MGVDLHHRIATAYCKGGKSVLVHLGMVLSKGANLLPALLCQATLYATEDRIEGSPT
jgi:hypothetical protein